MKETRRTRQVGDVVRSELARLLREDLRDPAIGFATITSVEMAPDLRSARVHVSVLGDEAAFEKALGALNRAAGHLRGLVGRGCGLRYSPELRFVADHGPEHGARIEALLKDLTGSKKDGGDGEP